MEWKRVLPLFILCLVLYQSDVSALKKRFKSLSGWTSKASLTNQINRLETQLIESSFTPKEELLIASRKHSGCSCSWVPLLGSPPAPPPPAIPKKIFFNNPTPVNSNPSSAGSLPDDGCGTSSGRFGVDQFIGKYPSRIYRRRIKRKYDLNPEFNIIKNQTDGCNNILNFSNCADNCTRQRDENAIKKDLENDENWIRIHGTWNFTDRSNCTQFDGECHQLLNSGPCNNPRSWFTLDPVTLKGQCTPRLCGRGRIFVGKTGLCHDSEDPNICSRGRKLYYTAYGDPICDCPVGEYPFPGEQDNCVTVFTRGPCPLGQVMEFSQSGTLQCTPSRCPFYRNDQVPLVPYEDGQCYPLGSQGPCRRQPFQLLGFDVFERRTVCINVTAIGSPYFESEQDVSKLDNNYDQLLPEYDYFRVSFFVTYPVEKRQGDALAAGLFQLPANFPKDPLLNPCRPGERNGNNYKCINPILFLEKKQRIAQAVRSAFECPGDTTLQATGQCGSDARSASCGPSYQYVDTIGECRAFFRP